MDAALSSSACCEVGGVRWWLRPRLRAAEAESVLAAALQQLAAGAENLKCGRRKELYRLELPDGAGECLLKVNRYDRGASRLRRTRLSKARRELAIALALRARGVATPLPYAAGEQRGGAGLDACYLLLPVSPGAHDLQAHWRRADTAPAERRAWIAALGTLARRLHAAGLEQRDFAPNNVLVLPGDPPTLLPIDFERARLRRRVGRRARTRSLARLDRHLSGASAAARWRFLLAYTAGDARAARCRWQELTDAAARLARHDHARLIRATRAAGRNVDVVDWGGWEGWVRRDAPERADAESGTRDPGAANPPRTLGRQFAATGTLWCGSGPVAPREARRLWAMAQLLWARRLGPRPVACVHRDGELRLWLARDSSGATLLERSDSAAAEAAAVVLFDRLLALGRVDPWLSPRKVALQRRPDGGLRAELIDPGAFRVGRPARRRRHARARRLLAERLREVRTLRRLLGESPP